MKLKVIAHIHTDFPEKFGVPRQSGLVQTEAEIVFEPEYRNPEALRGIEGYSHLWILWGFSESVKEGWSPTVRPPRLGGNIRVGVFATRSPFRPNPVGLSCVKLLGVRRTEKKGHVLLVSGADMTDGTPIYDIKPYLSYVDSHPDASGGFAEKNKDYCLQVEGEEEVWKCVPENQRKLLKEILSQDPRPSYQRDEERVYGMKYAGMEIKFRVKRNILTICSIEKEKMYGVR